jgi:hypothetical protein
MRLLWDSPPAGRSGVGWRAGSGTCNIGRDGGGGYLEHYRIGPLAYASELDLPELERAGPSAALPVIAIRLGRAPQRVTSPVVHGPAYEANVREFLFRVAGVATYYVRDGAEVIVDPVADAPAIDVRSYLLGSIFAAICHQRGLLPLHASAIATPRGAVAFLGDSGAGKSSLAAFLAGRGHAVLADDICLIDPSAPINSRVLPVSPWLKLWQTTLDSLGQPSHGLTRTFADENKYRIPVRTGYPAAALAEVILLDVAAEGGEAETVRFELLPPARAIHAVLELTYQWWLVRATGQQERYFLRCGQALQGVRVHRMYRPWGFDRMKLTLDALEAHLIQPG